MLGGFHTATHVSGDLAPHGGKVVAQSGCDVAVMAVAFGAPPAVCAVMRGPIELQAATQPMPGARQT